MLSWFPTEFSIGRQKTKTRRAFMFTQRACFARYSYSFVSIISIVETIRALVSPSLGGISCVPIAILLTFRSFRKRFLVISAASTAVVIACPLAFTVISLALLADRPVIIART